MLIKTQRLEITTFTIDMADDVHKNSLDEDNRRFVPDEVFETIEDATKTVNFLISCYDGNEGPFVYPIILNNEKNVGYVQLVQIEEGWEVGFHIAKQYTGHGFATEAVQAFLPVIMNKMHLDVIYGICLTDNIASRTVMENSGFRKIFEGIGEYQGVPRNICKYTYSC